MATENTRDAKLVQYLTEAHGKEKELETSLAAHIEMAQRDAYKKRLKQHLKETRQHAKQVERRLKKLGGGGVIKAAGDLASRGTALAKGPLHAVRGTGAEEKELKNAKTEYSDEHEEIAMYTAIETLAEEVGDKETAKLARSIRREEERMANFLAKQIPVLTKAVARAEIPSDERKSGSGGSRRKSSGGSRKSSGRSSAKPSSKSSGGSKSKSSGSKSKSKSSGSKSKSKSSGSRSKRSSGKSKSSGSNSRRKSS